jgi:ribosomal protein S18 acetylase RimI-like enzyme
MTAGDLNDLRPPRTLTGRDYASARSVVAEWFGHPVGLVMHRLFFEQLGPSGVWVADAAGEPAGFLLGLVSEAEPDLAYVHMHAVAPRLRGRGVGELLYREFCARAAARGCRRVRALAAPDRLASRRFHERLGFTGTWSPGYLGPGIDRYVFERALPLAADAHAVPTTRPRGESMASQPDPQDERRSHPRTEIELAVRVTGDGAGAEARSVNLSEGGILMAGDDFPSAAQVRVEIELAEFGWHTLDADVVRRGTDGDGRESLAVRFAEAATQGGRDAIREFFESRLA